MKQSIIVPLLSMSLFVSVPAGAAVLVDLNFDGNTAGAGLSGQLANNTGLTGNWASGGSGNAGTVTSGNLAFSDLNTGTGNRLVFTATGSGNLGAAINLVNATAYTGTLWYSGIVKITDPRATGPNDMSRIHVDGSTSASASWFRQLLNGSSNSFSAIAYDNGSANTGVTPTTDATYLVISRFTNVGISGVAATAATYVLTPAQYDALKQGSGGFTESDLIAGNVTATATDSVANTSSFANTFADGNWFKFGGIGTAGDAFTAEFDRIRYGSDFSSVVPEPASLSLLALAGCWMGRRSRR